MNIILIVIILCCLYKLFAFNYSYKKLENYNKDIEKELITCKKKIHEHKNELIIMKEMSLESSPLMLELINDDECYDSDLCYIRTPGLKSFIRSKISILKNLDCAIEVYVQADLALWDNKMNIKDERDLLIILGVILDNMIDACQESSKRLASIVITSDGKVIKSSFANSYENKVDINRVWDFGYTSKGVGHGLGLSYVRDVLKKNKKFSVDTELVDEFFVQNVYIDFN